MRVNVTLYGGGAGFTSCQGGGYLFYFWLLRYLEVTQLAADNYLLPVSASLLGVLLLGERGSWPELLGGALALAGVYFVESTHDK